LYEALQSKTYDYIVYIDSDCIFKDFGKSLEEFIRPYSNDILISNDYPFNSSKACTGFFVCKVNNSSLNFLKDWFNYDFKGRPNPSYWEQGALWLLYDEGKYDIQLFHNEDYFNDQPGQFLRHVATFVSISLTKSSGNSPDEKTGRNDYFKHFIEDRDIDYNSTVNNIKVVEFNTNSEFFKNTFYLSRPYLFYFDWTSIIKIILLILCISLVHIYVKTIVRNKRVAVTLEIGLIIFMVFLACLEPYMK
jgi:hypothetical protein